MIGKLGNVCQFLNGGTPSKAISSYFEGDIPWITSADISGPVVKSARSFITEEAIEKSATNRVAAGTVLLVTRTGVGKVAIAGQDLCFSQDITAIEPDGSKVDTGYLVHFLKTKQEYFERLARGATIKGITREIVTNLDIPLPSLPEQRRIAAILDHADALRAKRRESLTQLDKLAQSIFIEMFGHPVSNPMGWDYKKLSEVGVLERGLSKHRPRNAPELLGGPYPLVQTGDVANSNGYITQYSSTYSEIGLKQSRLWPKGTLCITIAANIARTGILSFNTCFPDSIVGFTASEISTVEYVRVWLSFLQKTLEETAPESAQKNINLAILRNLTLPVPPLALQEKFYQCIKVCRQLRDDSVRALDQLNVLVQSLQDRAFRGAL